MTAVERRKASAPLLGPALRGRAMARAAHAGRLSFSAAGRTPVDALIGAPPPSFSHDVRKVPWRFSDKIMRGKSGEELEGLS